MSFYYFLLHRQIGQGPPSVITPPSTYSLLSSQEMGQVQNIGNHNICFYIMPYVMLWNPLHQFQMHFRDGIRCFHEQCDSSLSVKVWKCGQTNALEPRIIHDVSNTILLVSAVYTCQNGHEVASTDPRILLQLTEEEHIPFILLHKTGFTRDFVHTALQLFVQGLQLTLWGPERIYASFT